MFDRFDERAIAAVEAAQCEARELGHNYIGTEHLLLGLLDDSESPPTRLLASRGVDATVVRGEIIDIIGVDEGPTSDSAVLLATIGIDVDEVRRRAETTFGPEAVRRAAFRTSTRRRWHRVRRSRVLSPFFGCSGPTRPCASPLTGGRWLSLTPRSKHVLELASKEAERRQQAHITPTRILIGILIEGQGLACQILSSRGVRIDDLTATARSVLDDSPDV